MVAGGLVGAGMHPTVPSGRNPQVLPTSHKMAAHSGGSVTVGGLVTGGIHPTRPSGRKPHEKPTKQEIAAHSGGKVFVGGLVGVGRHPTRPSGKTPQPAVFKHKILAHSGGTVGAGIQPPVPSLVIPQICPGGHRIRVQISGKSLPLLGATAASVHTAKPASAARPAATRIT